MQENESSIDITRWSLDPEVRPTLSAKETFTILGIDRATGYAAIKQGTFPVPVLRIGRIIRIPTAQLVRLLSPGPEQDDSVEAA